ncbi:MAG: Holliday junction resolvase RuvX [Thermomicrobiales bacterium]
MKNISQEIQPRIIGLDIGTHRIGIAISDELGLIASPETTIAVAQDRKGRERAIAEIAVLVRRFNARHVVAGLPRNMKGERGVQAEWTESFVADLRAMLNPEGIFVSLSDERLTSVQAERSFRDDAGSSRRKPTSKVGRQTVDARAAALILQGYLDQHRPRPATLLDDGRGES